MSKIVFANNPLDRMSSIRSDKEWQKTSMSSSDARYIIFDSGKPLIQVSKEPGSNSTIYLAKFDSIKKHFEACQVIFLGEIKSIKYYAIDITKERSHFDIEIFIGCKFIDLRSIAQSLSPEDTGILAQAKSMVEWNAANIFCSRCENSKLKTVDAGSKRVCINCKTELFPRVDPVVIMLPIYNEKCLLGRQSIFPPRMYSALAGFLEPGETIEDAVIREVKEEVGLNVNSVEYKFTQPWPFSSQLMIGCFSNVEDDKTNLDEDEIEHAVWLSREDINRIFVGKSPDRIWIPPAMAVAHQLIVEWLHSK